MLLLISLLLLVLIGGILLFLNTGLGLPSEVGKLVEETLTDELPEFMPGTKGLAQHGDVFLAYEVISPPADPKGSILLTAGYTQTLLDWPLHFIQPMLDAGYQVIRFDNRGVGESDWMKDWDKSTPYTLEDMAKDAIAVLDAVGVEKAHLVGMSMGGMISQRIALSHRQRVLSLTSIMSTAYYYDPDMLSVPRPFLIQFARLILRFGLFMKNPRNGLKLRLGIIRLLEGKSKHRYNAKETMQIARYEVSKRKGYNRAAGPQHSAAIKRSGSRYGELPTLELPTLVIHGTVDPLVTFPHGQKYAPMIPNAQSLFIEGMGHTLPEGNTPQMMQEMIALFAQTEHVSKPI